MAPEAVPANAAIASTGLGIRYVGDYAWAASGPISSADTIETMLDFTSGTGIILAKVEFLHTVITGIAIQFYIKFNGETVLAFISDGVPNYNGSHTYRILIPPITRVLITWTQDGTSKDGYAFLSGRVYGA